MTDSNFKKAQEFLKQVIEGTDQFGFHSGEMGIFFNPDKLSKEDAKRDWLRHTNEDSPFEFEVDDIIFEEAVDPETKQKVYIEKLSSELIKRVIRKEQV